MKKLFLLVILGMMIFENGKGQNLIAVQNGGMPTFFTTLQIAVESAQSGDTIYLPGGSFEAINIGKKLHLVGVGHNPDSSKVTARTIIPSIGLSTGADNGSLTGIYFPYTINYNGNTIPNVRVNQNIVGYTITRCYLSGFSDSGMASNVSFSENIIGDLSNGGPNCSLNNNIILRSASIARGQIQNNLFLNDCGIPYCTIENNIFNISIQTTQMSASICYNNVNSGSNGISSYNAQGAGNFLDGATLQSIFVNFDPSTISGDGIYKADFHLNPNSPYKNAGRDGTDIGIYGGAFPWKEGSIPPNPHFQKAQISPTTDTNGNLNVKIKVAAQDR